jgi:hypothetical protein
LSTALTNSTRIARVASSTFPSQRLRRAPIPYVRPRVSTDRI